MRLKIFILSGVLLLNLHNIFSQELSSSFELRYFTKDPKANGVTDFHGPTEVFSTKDRINFLKEYALYAREYFLDPELNTKLAPQSEVNDFLGKFKKQPMPEVRKRIIPDNWRYLGYKDKQHEESINNISEWNYTEGVNIQNYLLTFTENEVRIKKEIPIQDWRMNFSLNIIETTGQEPFSFELKRSDKTIIKTGINSEGNFYYYSGKKIVKSIKCEEEKWYSINLEIDFLNLRYNLYINGNLIADFVSFKTNSIKEADNIVINGGKGIYIDNIKGTGFKPGTNIRSPYFINTFINENFELKPEIKGWHLPDYDDSKWKGCYLPKVHGGERYEGESLYLRNRFYIGDFERINLKIETLDPGGEIWINGRIADVVKNRHPVNIDISRYCIKNSENLIAIKVNPNFSQSPVFHGPSDKNVGWFAGRIMIDITDKSYIEEVLVNAKSVNNPAIIRNRIRLVNEKQKAFKGFLRVRYYEWFPEDSENIIAETSFPVDIDPTARFEIDGNVLVNNPHLWSFDNPVLYKMEYVLLDSDNNPVDDFVITSGIRLIDQKGGTFRINEKPEMLNGAQIMGYRVPAENLALWNRCPPPEILAEELLMLKKMDANLLRIHVHFETYKADGVNDPRIAEMCDQLGIMLIWTTASWPRQGDYWNIDFEGLPKYIKQVYNHPSIVMWEATNHPWGVDKHDIKVSNRFYEEVWNTIYPLDRSRLISPTSHNLVTHFGNDEGTIDDAGNPIIAVREYTEDKITRGNQDSYTGYGKLWTELRTIPTAYHSDMLNSSSRAYFNFEHEESTAQPNWNLMKGKPWYQIPSYEWDYDKGSIGRRLDYNEWLESMAWQAFSAWESMKMQRLVDYDGFSWCCLHGGPNMGTYRKPLIDCLGHAKLAFYTNKMLFQRVVAGSANVDVVFGPEDLIEPVIMNLDEEKKVNFEILISDLKGKIIQKKIINDVILPEGRTVTKLPEFKPMLNNEGYYIIEYKVIGIEN